MWWQHLLLASKYVQQQLWVQLRGRQGGQLMQQQPTRHHKLIKVYFR
jgi:hypothetical protein